MNCDPSKLTPLFQQYFSLKEQYPDCLLLMQCGDFYEAYGEDAADFARDLEIVLTAKEAGGGQKIAMAGVPIHAIDVYLRGLVAKGHRVAIAEQTMDPSQCKGLVPREVVRVITAGTIVDSDMLDEKNHNYLVCLAADKDKAGFACADISTGDFMATQFELSVPRLIEELGRFQAKEVVLAGARSNRGMLKEAAGALEASITESPYAFNAGESAEMLMKEFGLGSLHGFDLDSRPQAIIAAATLVRYLHNTALRYSVTLEPPHGYEASDCMVIDANSRRNLELTETLLGRERSRSLLGIIDRTCTSMGARRLQEWMMRPLIDLKAISARHDICETFCDNYETTSQLRGSLEHISDMERLLSRIIYGSANARDLLALAKSLASLPEIAELLGRYPDGSLKGLEKISLHEELCDLLNRAIAEAPPLTLREGGIIRDGFNDELDELRGLRANSKSWISQLEEREREATGIRTLKVGYTSVFGYYIEVTKANSSLVPDHYVRKQTLVNSERYIIPELKSYESKVLSAEDRIRKLEYDLFIKIREAAAEQSADLRRTARTLADIDVFCSFAETAITCGWVRPELCGDAIIDLQDSRHPVVEAARGGDFVPNDCFLDRKKYLIILTGPNMSGKSTWLRQVAQIVILNQMGSFVPCSKARLGVIDRVFTRVGASDDLHLGQSTFMVEMSEAANILNNATPRSLVILDEIGRGTSTYDGVALARAVAEHLHDSIKSFTLFATHFHELTRLERTLKGCRNCRVSVKEMPDSVVFLHKIVPGAADRSYGIYVAKLAGMPESVLKRAECILKKLESESKKRVKEEPLAEQIALFGENCQ
ncbi:MAG: DNA mismatch repair protein MutS [bacterium]|nr:DNA mismatch repair protein MutS [bacterium]